MTNTQIQATLTPKYDMIVSLACYESVTQICRQYQMELSRKPERYSLMSIIIDRFDLPETREKSALLIGCISPCCVNVENLLSTNPGKSLLKLIYIDIWN